MTDVRLTTVTDDRERWNAKFLAGEAQSVEPDPLLVEVCADLTSRPRPRPRRWRRSPRPLARPARMARRPLRHFRRRPRHRRKTRHRIGRRAHHPSRIRSRNPRLGERKRALRPHRRFLVSAAGPLSRVSQRCSRPDGLLLYKTYTTRATPATPRATRCKPPSIPANSAQLFPPSDTILYRETKGVAELVARSEQ